MNTLVEKLVIDLDEVPQLSSGARGKYADKLVIACSDAECTAVIVEEAKRVTKRDLDQAVATASALKRGELDQVIQQSGANPSTIKSLVIALHRLKKVDAVTASLARVMEKRLGVPIYIVECSRNLDALIERVARRARDSRK